MKDELVLNNLKLIWYVIKKLNLYKKAEYYYDIGLIGLVKAANTFNPNKGYKFNTYAIRVIRNQILADMRKVRVDDYAVSLDMPINSNDCKNDIYLIDLVPDDFNMEESILNKEKIEILIKAINKLDTSEKEILKLYLKGKTQREMKDTLHISQSYVSRKFNKIINKLKKEVLKDGNYIE